MALSHAIYGQVGNAAFTFLNTPAHARLTALGGQNVSLADRDLNFVSSNPALVSDSLAGTGSAGYQFYLADIGHSQFAYAHPFKRWGTFTFAVQHMGYGPIESYDETGLSLGTVNANETALYISRSHQAGHFRLGANLKGIFSNMAGYRAQALALDVGVVFIHPSSPFTVGLAMRNAGLVLNGYTDNSLVLPFDLAAGITFKPVHMPLRFSVTAHHLDEVQSSDPENEKSTLEKAFSHLNLGGEILLSKNVNVLVGYNFLTHQELTIETLGSSAGFSLGFSVRVKQFECSVARASYQRGSASYSFTLTGHMKSILKGKRNHG